MNVKIVPCPATCLLGYRTVQLKSREERKIIGLAFLAAKQMILSNWEVHKPRGFSLEKWVSLGTHWVQDQVYLDSGAEVPDVIANNVLNDFKGG